MGKDLNVTIDNIIKNLSENDPESIAVLEYVHNTKGTDEFLKLADELDRQRIYGNEIHQRFIKNDKSVNKFYQSIVN